MDIFSKESARAFLSNNSIAVVATFDTESKSAQAGVVYYYLDGRGRLVFSTSKDSRKIVNIQKNPGVGAVVMHESKPVELQIEGDAQIVQNTEQKAEILGKIALIANKSPRTMGWPPLLTLSMNSGVECIEIHIRRFKYSDFSIHPGTVITGTGEELLFNNG